MQNIYNEDTLLEKFRRNGYTFIEGRTGKKQNLNQIRELLSDINPITPSAKGNISYTEIASKKIPQIINYLNNDTVDKILKSIFPKRYSSITALCVREGKGCSRNEALQLGQKDLYKSDDLANEKIKIPAFETLLITPLEPTRHDFLQLWPGSHLTEYFGKKDQLKKIKPCSLKMNIGEFLIMDSRLAHQFLGNPDKLSRLDLIIRYSMPWYRCCADTDYLPRLRIEHAEYEQLDDNERLLFSYALRSKDWTQHPK